MDVLPARITRHCAADGPNCTACTGDSVHEPVHGRGAVSDYPVTVCNIVENIGLTFAANGGTVWRALIRVSSVTHLMRLT